MEMFEFEMRAAVADSFGYYYAEWKQAQKITVRAKTQSDAIDKALGVLAPAPHLRYWAFKTDSIKEVNGE